MRIILLRHGESLGNVDELAYCRTPDHSLPLTALGEAQAARAGADLRALLGDEPVAAYVSPYVRTVGTFRLLDLPAVQRCVPEPRLREQDWGNLQDPDEQQVQKRLRHEFGHFFYRLPHGESGADVDDRVASFLSELEHRVARDPHHPDTAVVVSHGLTVRLLCRRAFSWSIDLFESLSNPAHCDPRVLTRVGDAWTLDRPFEQWRPSPDGTHQV
ncbi:histidine phosphatase family protein [Actinokineospora sp. PR83]|uniref:histidine phosphatase family protein n=1 Tax=Actinokineospora sp. PR83 TaxID=2884908 RepID=UPI001F2BAFEA|nr:histidine phosphatase family protein [Actinokineospora sp. PR83]MCG8917370.1 histidine phosphatase family protein [Actinokineospora sp. PR83]